MFLHPDVCPSCNTKPYPRGEACTSCGFVGEEWDHYQRFRARHGRWLLILLAFIILCAVIPVVIMIIG